MLYVCKRSFRLWAYTVSHSSLILRSELKAKDQEGFSDELSFNIDIEFWDVTYLNIPCELSGLEIKEVHYKTFPFPINPEILEFDRKVFEIKSDSRKYYIIAYGILIGQNNWIGFDRIFSNRLNLEHDKILLKYSE